MNYEQTIKLALIERKLVNAVAANVKFTPVPGQGLWPRALAEITCKNYGYKPPVKRVTVTRSHGHKRDKCKRVTVRTFDAAQIAAANDQYVAMLNAMAMRHKRALLVGEVRR